MLLLGVPNICVRRAMRFLLVALGDLQLDDCTRGMADKSCLSLRTMADRNLGLAKNMWVVL
jgi:hypothetical protein